MKIGVLGPGALGCLFAAKLSRTDHETVLFDHRPERAAYLAKSGLTIEEGNGIALARPKVSCDLTQGFDLIIVLVKAHATAALTLPPHTPVLTLQNGLNNAETLAEKIGARYAATLRFVIQGIGLAVAILTGNLFGLYTGFFLYGIGLGGNMVLPDILWANYFGRRSLGRIRGMGLLVSQVLAAMGPPFFGFLFDITGGYGLSFAIFGAVLIISALLSLMLKPPRQPTPSIGVME